MSPDRVYRKLIPITVVWCMLVYCLSDAKPLLFIVACTLALTGWVLTEGKRRVALPRPLNWLLLLAVLGWVGLSVLREGTFNVSVFSEFIVFLLISRMFDRKRPRELAQIITLCLFLIVGAILTSNSFGVGVLLLASVPLFIALIVLHQMYAGGLRARRAQAEVGNHARSAGGETGEPTPTEVFERVRIDPHAAAGRRIKGNFRTLIATSTIATLAFSAVIFVVMPRSLGAPGLRSFGSVSLGPTIGFTDQVRLGRGGLLSESPQVVADVQVLDSAGQPMANPPPVIYLRGAVLDVFEDSQWRSSLPERWGGSRGPRGRSAGYVEVGPSREMEFGAGRRAETILRVTLRGVARQDAYLFTSWQPVWLRPERETNLRRDPRTQAVQRSGEAGRFLYEVGIATDLSRLDGDNTGPRGVEFFNRLRADIDPRVRLLAVQLAEQAGIAPTKAGRTGPQDEQALAGVIERHLRQSYEYSLELEAAPRNRDAVEWFLFEQQSGNCEYFASAMALMCSALEINARVVTGYVAAEWNPISRAFTVRASNAHAWVEVQVADDRWQTFDPTPSSDFEDLHIPANTIAQRFRRWFAALEYGYIENVVGFDSGSRERLIGASDDASVERRFSELARFADRLQRGGPREIARVLGLAVGLAVATVVIGALLLRLLPRLLASRIAVLRWAAEGMARVLRTARPQQQDPQERFYRDALAELRKAGLEKPGHAPPLTHARSLGDEALRRAFEAISAILYRYRYANEPLAPADLEAAERHLGVIRTYSAQSKR